PQQKVTEFVTRHMAVPETWRADPDASLAFAVGTFVNDDPRGLGPALDHGGNDAPVLERPRIAGRIGDVGRSRDEIASHHAAAGRRFRRPSITFAAFCAPLRAFICREVRLSFAFIFLSVSMVSMVSAISSSDQL